VCQRRRPGVVGEDGEMERDRYVDGELELWSMTLAAAFDSHSAAATQRSILSPAS
jgi:hypothetical protein